MIEETFDREQAAEQGQQELAATYSDEQLLSDLSFLTRWTLQGWDRVIVDELIRRYKNQCNCNPW
jgi:hypothetical protein